MLRASQEHVLWFTHLPDVRDGEFSSIPLTLEEARGALLATHLGDAPLPHAHGWPVRLVVPGADCFTSIKWLDRIELRAEPGDNTGRVIALARLPG